MRTAIRERLSSPIESLANAIRPYLQNATAEQSSIVSWASLDDESDPTGNALNGPELKAEKPPVIRHDPSTLVAAYRRFLREAIEVGEPVHLVVLRFKRVGSDWVYDASVETSAAYKKLEDERASLDQSIAKAMVEAAREPWTDLVFEQRLPEPVKFVVFNGKARQEVELTTDLHTLLKRVFELYARYERELLWPRWSVKGEPADYEVEPQIWYL